MVLIDLQSVLGTLGLVSSIAKPLPVVGPTLGGLIGTVGSTVNATLPAASGPLNGLLPGLVGAVNVTPDKDGTIRASDTTDDQTTTFETASSDSDPCAMSPYTPEPVYLESFAPYDANQALIYRYRQQQSVNLGSWFVQEQWMIPSLFTCAAGNKQAELDIANGWGSVDNARQVLEKHWDTWITEDDFAYMASIGESLCLAIGLLLILMVRYQHRSTAYRVLVPWPDLLSRNPIRTRSSCLCQLMGTCRPSHQLGRKVRSRYPSRSSRCSRLPKWSRSLWSI
jgi:hypothetical protein